MIYTYHIILDMRYYNISDIILYICFKHLFTTLPWVGQIFTLFGQYLHYIISGLDTGCFQHRYTNFGYTNVGMPKFNLK